MVLVPTVVIEQYDAFTCYNSPYVAHDDGRAIDLYPAGSTAPSPVNGEVIDMHTVRAPPKPYANEFDHILAIDTAAGGDAMFQSGGGEPTIARILHVEPTVSVGDQVEIGDTLGELVRAGFFAPWVDNHIHLGFRRRESDLRRASGSLELAIDVPIVPITWDGHGQVRSLGETFVMLDVSVDTHGTPRPRDWVGMATGEGAILDGGMPHYANGGLLDRLAPDALSASDVAVSLLDTEIGVATGRRVSWHALNVYANETVITGISFYCSRWSDLGIKLICPAHDFHVGQHVDVEIRREPIEG